MNDHQQHDANMTTHHEVDVNTTLQTDEGRSGDKVGDVKNQEDQPQQPTDEDEETRCGIGAWRPRCLQPLGNMWCFTAAMSLMSIFNGANFAYYVAVITQIERRFGLSSRTTGFIKNVDNIGFMLMVLIISHLGRYGNKPRIIVVSAFISSLAIFMFATPHFIYGGRGASFQAASPALNATLTAERRQEGLYEVCDGVDESLGDPSGCSSRSTLLEFNAGAMAIFVISELLQGMANSPKPTLSLTFMDDNARERSPIYFGK